MNRRIVPALAALAVLAAAVWFFALRDRGGATKPREVAATGSAPKAEGSGRDKRGDGPGPRGDSGELTVLIDDDPAGELRLEGLVLDAAEQPVPGAVVSVSSNPRRSVTTDENGEFAFDKMMGRSYSLAARAPGGVAGPVTAKLTAKSDPVVLRLKPAGSVKVTVVGNEKKPVAAATVELRGLDEQLVSADASGVATFPAVVAGGYEVVAQAPGYAPAKQFTMVTTGATELTMALVSGASVAGRVIDEAGKPVAGARVLYSGASDWGLQADERRDGVMSGPDGAFAFTALPAGSFRFVARHEEYAPGSSAIVTLDGTTPVQGVEVKLTGGATVAGRVVDGSQAPVAGARVRVGVASRGMIGMEPRQVYSGADGGFVVRGLPRKPLEAVAVGETGSSANVPIDTTAGDVKDLVITIDQTGTIAGIVVDKNGEPLEGVQVSAMPDFRAGGFDPGQFRLRGLPAELTSSAGTFEIVGLAPGSYLVRASRSGGLRARMAGLDGGEKATAGTRNLRIVLPADGGVKGKVQFADGTVPTPFTVGVGFANEPVASDDGTFELNDLPPQKYTLSVRGPAFDQKSVQIVVEEGKVADAGTIVVTKGRVIAGRVVDANGVPVPGATVWAGRQIFGTGSSNEAQFGGPPGARDTRTATTDEQGAFRISGLIPANLVVVAEQADLGRSPARRVLKGAPDESALVLQLTGWGVLTGRVKDANGPAADTIVTAQAVSSPSAMYSVASGADGTFRFDKLAPDVYKVSAMLGNPMRGMSFYSKKVTVAVGTPASVELAVERGTFTIKLHVTAKNGTVKGGMAWLISAPVTPATIDELNVIVAGLAENQSKWGFLFGAMAPTWDGLQPGRFTVCVGLMPAEISDPRGGMEYFARHGDELPVTCKAIVIGDGPTEQTVDIEGTLPPYIKD